MFDIRGAQARSIRSRVGNIRKLFDAEKFAEAAVLIDEVLQIARDSDLNHAWAAWARCVALDMTGSHAAALDAAKHACTLDPTNPAVWSSLEAVLANLRAAVVDPRRTDEDRIRFYHALAAEGAAQYEEQLAYTRLLAKVGQRADALALALMVASLSPTGEAKELVSELRAAGGEN